jgi:hypothetical protein
MASSDLHIKVDGTIDSGSKRLSLPYRSPSKLKVSFSYQVNPNSVLDLQLS